MSNSHEAVLAEIPGSCEGERLLVVHRQVAGASRIELRQQTWGVGVGWFTQNTMPLEPSQVGQLRATLGGSSAMQANPTVQFGTPKRVSNRANANGERPPLRIHAESA